MAVKITRQPKNVVLLGAATSAAAIRSGAERAPEALRSAGLADSLKTAGFHLLDHGNTSSYVSQQDDEHPRAKNVPAILKLLNDLRPRVEAAVKTGALPLIVSGDGVSVLATIAGTRRYFRNVSLIYMDRDADLNVPATTSSGSIDGMVISQVIGRGAPELVRFWGEPPLVREPDIALFGFDRVDASEEQYLLASHLRRHPYLDVAAAGAANAARTALERVHAAKHEFVLHFDVDLISGEEFPWTNFPGTDGLSLSDVRDALGVFVSQSNLAAFEIAGYNPDLDADGRGARTLIELLTAALSKRMEVLTGSAEESAGPVSSASAVAAAGPASVPATVSHTEGAGALTKTAAAPDSSASADPEPYKS